MITSITVSKPTTTPLVVFHKLPCSRQLRQQHISVQLNGLIWMTESHKFLLKIENKQQKKIQIIFSFCPTMDFSSFSILYSSSTILTGVLKFMNMCILYTLYVQVYVYAYMWSKCEHFIYQSTTPLMVFPGLLYLSSAKLSSTFWTDKIGIIWHLNCSDRWWCRLVTTTLLTVFPGLLYLSSAKLSSTFWTDKTGIKRDLRWLVIWCRLVHSSSIISTLTIRDGIMVLLLWLVRLHW